jgi:hypothetical protein
MESTLPKYGAEGISQCWRYFETDLEDFYASIIVPNQSSRWNSPYVSPHHVDDIVGSLVYVSGSHLDVPLESSV